MTRHTGWVVTLAALLVACGGGASGTAPRDPPPTDEPHDPPATTRTVSGLQFTTYHAASGAAVDVPDDLTGTVVAALVPTDSGYRELAGTGDSAGRFQIEGVPQGEYLLRLGDTYYATALSDLDAGVDLFGRPPLPPVADGTMLAIALDGFSPFTESDWIDMVAPEANNWTFGVSEGPLTVGATTLSVSRPFAEVFAFDGGIDAGLGDHIVVGQLTPASSLNAIVLTRAAILEGFTATAGTAPLVGTLAELPMRSLDLSLTPAAFFAARAPAPVEDPTRAPTVRAGTLQAGLNVIATRSPLAFGRTGAPIGAAYVTLNPDAVVDGSSPTIPLRYGTLGDGWNSYVDVAYQWTTKYRYAPGLLETSIAQVVRVIDAEQALTSAPIVPRVSAPRQARMADVSFGESVRGRGVTPIVSWAAPEVGTATWYELQVWELSAVQMRSTRTRRARLITAATSIRIPPGVLEGGHMYVLDLRAVSVPGIDRRAQLRRQSFPYAEAIAASGVYEP